MCNAHHQVFAASWYLRFSEPGRVIAEEPDLTVDSAIRLTNPERPSALISRCLTLDGSRMVNRATDTSTTGAGIDDA